MNYLKLGLDIVIALVFALLFNPRVMGGLTFHETAGIAIGAAILTHILLNFRWVKNVTAKLFCTKLSKKARFSYLLNIMLLILMSITIVTGILISRVLFPNLSVGNPFMIRHLHSMASNLTLLLVGVHLGIHWQWVMNVLKKMFILKGRKPRVGGIAAAFLLVGLFIGGYQYFQAKFTSSQSASIARQMQFNKSIQGRAGGRIGNSGQAAPVGSGFNAVDENQNFHGAFNGSFAGRMGHGGGFSGHGEGSPLSVIITYFGIMSIIMIPTYYVEKRILRKKRKLKENPAS